MGRTRAGWTWYLGLATVVVLIAIACMLYALFRATLELRLFIAFAFMVLTASLIFPMASFTVPQWYIMQIPGAGVRYWFLPMVAYVATLVWLLADQVPRPLRFIAAVALLTMVMGIFRDWRYHPYSDLRFAEYAQAFIRLPKGSRFSIPINPPG